MEIYLEFCQDPPRPRLVIIKSIRDITEDVYANWKLSSDAKGANEGFGPAQAYRSLEIIRRLSVRFASKPKSWLMSFWPSREREWQTARSDNSFSVYYSANWKIVFCPLRRAPSSAMCLLGKRLVLACSMELESAEKGEFRAVCRLEHNQRHSEHGKALSGASRKECENYLLSSFVTAFYPFGNITYARRSLPESILEIYKSQEATHTCAREPCTTSHSAERGKNGFISLTKKIKSEANTTSDTS